MVARIVVMGTETNVKEAYKKVARQLSGQVSNSRKTFPRNEPPHGKTSNVVFDQVRHKPTCTVTEGG